MQSETASIAVTYIADDDESHAGAARLAHGLNLSLVEPAHAEARADLLLTARPERLELRDARDARIKPIFVDFSRAGRLTRRDPLARAIGAKNQTVIDVTAGLGQDSFLLASLGYRVTALERSLVVAALLEDGLARALGDAAVAKRMGDRLNILIGDAREALPKLAQADVVYLDPMFPPKRKKSAAVRKEMRFLRMLVGEDEDAAELLAIARRHAKDRVVVKRPDDAPPLAEPTMSYPGKLVRYDVYRSHG